MEQVTIPQYTGPDFTKFVNFSGFLGTPLLIIIFLLFTAFYVIVSLVLFYHWSKYGMRSSGIIIAETLYVFVSAVLLFFASLAVLYY